LMYRSAQYTFRLLISTPICRGRRKPNASVGKEFPDGFIFDQKLC
jgi:hypothetical protein